jgi:hypothetical protein
MKNIKNLTIVLLVAAFFAVSCGDSSSSKSDKKETTEKKAKKNSEDIVLPDEMSFHFALENIGTKNPFGMVKKVNINKTGKSTYTGGRNKQVFGDDYSDYKEEITIKFDSNINPAKIEKFTFVFEGTKKSTNKKYYQEFSLKNIDCKFHTNPLGKKYVDLTINGNDVCNHIESMNEEFSCSEESVLDIDIGFEND